MRDLRCREFNLQVGDKREAETLMDEFVGQGKERGGEFEGGEETREIRSILLF